MMLDQNRIVIRERGYLEILDLAVRVVRTFGGPLAVALVVGVLPVQAFNAWLLSGVAQQDFALEAGRPSLEYPFLGYLMLLVFLESPLATAPLTLFLGQAAFSERPSAREVARGFLAVLPQLVVFQGLLRWWFVGRPYLTEIVVLERNPMRPSRGQQLSTVRRSRALHRGEGADLFVRSIFSLMIGGVLFVSLWLSIYFFRSVLGSQWQWERSMYTIFFPLALWMVVGFFAVVRFLAYLDLRIRREGWEVELLMRAEQARLTRSWP